MTVQMQMKRVSVWQVADEEGVSPTRGETGGAAGMPSVSPPSEPVIYCIVCYHTLVILAIENWNTSCRNFHYIMLLFEIPPAHN